MEQYTNHYGQRSDLPQNNPFGGPYLYPGDMLYSFVGWALGTITSDKKR
jgi:hypothetical protein